MQSTCVATYLEDLTGDVDFVLILPFTDGLFLRKDFFVLIRINKLRTANIRSKCHC